MEADIFSLIAIMLGRLNMTDEQAKDVFRAYARSIFRPRQNVRKAFRKALGIPPYSEESLVRATKLVVEYFDPSVESQKWKRNLFSAPGERCGWYDKNLRHERTY